MNSLLSIDSRCIDMEARTNYIVGNVVKLCQRRDLCTAYMQFPSKLLIEDQGQKENYQRHLYDK